MKSERPLRHFVFALAIALAFYIVSFAWIQHRREFKGPWQVTFITDGAGRPSLHLQQPYFKIDQTILFPSQTLASNGMKQTIQFPEARDEIPFGKIIFQDPTFLPGTLTMNFFQHDIELLPRVLIIDKKEHPWQRGEIITLP